AATHARADGEGRLERLPEVVPVELPLLAAGQHLPPRPVHLADQGQIRVEVLHLYLDAAGSGDHKQVDLPLLLPGRDEVRVDPRRYPAAPQVGAEPVEHALFVVILDGITE